MAWTAPLTWTANSTLTAAQLNQQLRDNLLETCAATATTAGDLIYADAANSMGSRVAIGSDRNRLVSDGSAPVWRGQSSDADTASNTDTTTSYDTLNGWGFSSEVEVSVTTGTAALVLFSARLSNNTAGSTTYLSYSISGSTTSGAADTRAIWYESGAANDQARISGFDYRTAITAGSNTFTLEGKVSGNTGTISHPEIFVMAF